jgi:hypothetical protein
MDNTLRTFLSDPIWNGIEGLIALILFLIYLWEKRDSWTSPIKFITKTIILLVVGLTPLAIIVYIFSFVAFTLSAQPLDWIRLLLFSLLVSVFPTLTAMMTEDKRLSEKLAGVGGAVYGATGAIYTALNEPLPLPYTLARAMALIAGGYLYGWFFYHISISKAKTLLARSNK